MPGDRSITYHVANLLHPRVARAMYAVIVGDRDAEVILDTLGDYVEYVERLFGKEFFRQAQRATIGSTVFMPAIFIQ
ncbi:MAG: hypothetical protein ACOYEQ_05895 [Bacillota bacterium]|jgi:hypothetical protein